MNECKEGNDLCMFRFSSIEERLDISEDKNEKRVEKEGLIERAILEIQISSSLTAKTLEKLEERFESMNKTKDDKWLKLFEKVVLVGAGIIGALLGVKLL